MITAAVTIPLSVDVFSLAYDPERNAVWYPVMSLDGSAALTISADSVLVARNNVPYLQQWSLDMKKLANVPPPSGGSRTLDMITRAAGILAAATAGPSTGTGQTGGLGGHVVVVPFGATPAPVLALQPASLKIQQGDDVALLSPAGTPMLTVDPVGHAADWLTLSGKHRLIPWPAQTIYVGAPPGRNGTGGTTVKTFTEPSLSAALVTPAGSPWLVKSTGTATTLEEHLPGQ